MRSESGHRRYPISAVEQLKLVVRALEARHAPSVVLRASPEILQSLVNVQDERPRDTEARARLSAGGEAGTSFEARCTQYVLALDGEGLSRLLERAWDELGGLECLILRVGPFLSALGTGWSKGLIEVGHEHFASEHVREFLSGHWRPMSEQNQGPTIVCATLGGELHVLGLHMAATALALAGARLLFLGANTPAEDVARATKSQRGSAIALSAAAGTPKRPLERELKALRRLVPQRIPILLGGSGLAKPPQGVQFMGDLRALTDWAERRTEPTTA